MFRANDVKYFVQGVRVTAYRANGGRYTPKGSELEAAHVAQERYFEAFGYASAKEDGCAGAAMAFGEWFASRAFLRVANGDSSSLPTVRDAYEEYAAVVATG